MPDVQRVLIVVAMCSSCGASSVADPSRTTVGAAPASKQWANTWTADRPSMNPWGSAVLPVDRELRWFCVPASVEKKAPRCMREEAACETLASKACDVHAEAACSSSDSCFPSMHICRSTGGSCEWVR